MRRLIGPMACFMPMSLVAAACAPLTAFLPAEPSATLVPWPTATATLPRLTASPTAAATAEVGPSATPFKHVVVKDETLLGIAALYGVSLDSLMAVNPDLNPFALSIGTELLIPGPEGTPIGSLIPTSTPIPLAIEPPTCYRRASGGDLCIAAISNPTAQDLENLVVEIRVFDSSGEVVQAAQVFPPLNRLPAGVTMPVAAAFPDGVPERGSVSARVLSVIAAREEGARYSIPQLAQTASERQEGGLSWLVEGTIRAAADAPRETRTMILATAFDDDDRVVGYAVWQAEPALEPAEARDFSLRVFSLGPEIARVELTPESYRVLANDE